MQIKMNWAGGIKFEAINVFGHKMITDGSKEAGGDEAGFKPTELLLYAVAGCTGIDVVRILEKQRQKLESLEIEVVAHQDKDYPRPFHTIEVKYRAKGENLDPKKLAMAIELSEAKYCVVSQTIQAESEVKTSYEII